MPAEIFLCAFQLKCPLQFTLKKFGFEIDFEFFALKFARKP